MDNKKATQKKAKEDKKKESENQNWELVIGGAGGDDPIGNPGQIGGESNQNKLNTIRNILIISKT